MYVWHELGRFAGFRDRYDESRWWTGLDVLATKNGAIGSTGATYVEFGQLLRGFD